MSDPRMNASDSKVAADHPLRQVRFTGTSLIEASAGTGKTWTITGLYLRLLVEADLEPRAILAVTFTNAATAELRDRIRSALADLIDHLRGTHTSEDSLVLCVAERVAPDTRAATLARLRVALDGFDESVICTIHSFCQRALADWAFESRMPFEAELIADEHELLAEIARDFWRRESVSFSAPFARYVAMNGLGPEVLAGRPFSRLLAPAAPEPIVPAAAEIDDAAFQAAYATARSIWLVERDAIVDLLATAKTWDPRSVSAAARALDAYFAGEIAALEMDEFKLTGHKIPAIARFAANFIAEQKNSPKTAHPFFEQAQRLYVLREAALAAFPARFTRLGLRFVEQARGQLETRKRATGRQSYDDLLSRLAQALAGPAGDALAKRLAGQFHAALIDEFQDTDGDQYAIFRRIFVEHGRPLVLVGDPKQAIYAFRGADVFTYLAAASESSPLTLATNRRSSQPLVAAVNALFATPRAFAIDGIAFHPAQPLDKPKARLIMAEPDAAALVLWWGEPLPSKSHDSKGKFGPRVTEATADEIVRLLAPGATAIESAGVERALVGSDIAVLVDTHKEAAAIRAALAARGIGSVTYGQSSVYASIEAVEFARVLEAVADPLDPGRLRAALATRIGGYDAGALATLADRASEWDAIVDAFTRLRELTRRSGVMRLWRELAAAYRVADRFAGRADGARALTNFGHLAEMLHAEASDAGLELDRIAARLREHTAAAIDGERSSAPDDPALLRLESDGKLVRVLTIHTSKGLEFPIVFCPFLWNGGLEPRGPQKVVACSFHDEAKRARIDFGGDRFEEHAERAQYETLGEHLRLAYVALTRAELRLYVPWGNVTESWASALAWLIHRDTTIESVGDALAALRSKFGGPAAAKLRGELDPLAALAGGAVAVRDLPEPLPQEAMRGVMNAAPNAAGSEASSAPARQFRHPPLAARRIASFSGMVAAVPSEAPDHDAFASIDVIDAQMDDATAAALPDDPIFAFPRGAQAGSALHALFETVDFAQVNVQALRKDAATILERFDLPTSSAPTAVSIVRHTISVQLGADAPRLADISLAARAVELEFVFPIGRDRRVDLAALGALLGKHRAMRGLPAGAVIDLEGALAPGFMKGFVDLVFEANGRYYLADYKSNFLGASIAHYGPAQLAAAMSAEWYDLQYLLYCVALDRLLAWRCPGYDYERDFGGVFYLFLRGMRADGAPGQGVYFDRPPRAIVAELAALLGSAR